MKQYSKKWVAAAIATAIGLTTVQLAAAQDAGKENSALQPKLFVTNTTITTGKQAMIELQKLAILQGYPDQSLREAQPITRAELATLLVNAFNLEGSAEAPNSAAAALAASKAWYAADAATLLSLDIISLSDEPFDPQGAVSSADLVQIVAKALKRDVKSVDYWTKAITANPSVTRGEAAALIYKALAARPSSEAHIKSVKALNAITLVVEMDKPLTAADEAFDKAKQDFIFTNGLALTNMPRLLTGSIATYIVPTSVQASGTAYELTYKGQATQSFTGSDRLIDLTHAEQVTDDTFEIEALKANGVTDYGYIITAYSAGRGANAFIVDQNLAADGVTYNVISSMQARQVTITPEGGAPIVAKYVPFTQSTDGRQEPKFRLPEGQVLTPGVKYTVTSDWATIANPVFTAQKYAPLTISHAEAINDSSITIELSADPGDELFSGRSVELTSPDGEKITATYVYSSRKGAAGTFNLNNGSKLQSGKTYTVRPLNNWATVDQITLLAK